MKSYKLYCKTTNFVRFDVDAETLEEAIRKLRDGEGQLEDDSIESTDDPHGAEWTEWSGDSEGLQTAAREGLVPASELIAAIAACDIAELNEAVPDA